MIPTHVQHYIDAFEALTPATLATLENCFDERAHFVDPFNDVRGRAAIRNVFEHMFSSCDNPRFAVDECVGADRLYYLRWSFEFGAAGRRRSVRGTSRIAFGDDGRVREHHDFWDPASQLYEHLPLIGRLFRALRRRLGAGDHKPLQTETATSATT